MDAEKDLRKLMKSKNYSLNVILRALCNIADHPEQDLVDMSKLMDLVRRDQLGPVMDGVIAGGTQFPESSPLFMFAQWISHKQAKKVTMMIDAILSRDWDTAREKSTELEIPRRILEDVFNLARRDHMMWVMRKLGKEKYLTVNGVKKTKEGREPDSPMQASIEKILPTCLMPECEELEIVNAEKLKDLVRRDQLNGIINYIGGAAHGYPANHRVYGFMEAILSLCKMTPDEVLTIVNAMLAYDEDTVYKMCKTLGIDIPVWSGAYRCVWNTEIAWVLWKTGNVRYAYSTGEPGGKIYGNAYDDKKVEPSKDLMMSIEKFIPECKVMKRV